MANSDWASLIEMSHLESVRGVSEKSQNRENDGARIVLGQTRGKFGGSLGEQAIADDDAKKMLAEWPALKLPEVQPCR